MHFGLQLIIEIRVRHAVPPVAGALWRDREESERDGNANARATPTARSRGDGPRAPPAAARRGVGIIDSIEDRRIEIDLSVRK